MIAGGIECIVAGHNGRRVTGADDLRNIGTAKESVIANLGHTHGNRHTGQAGTIVEGILSYGGNNIIGAVIGHH